MKYSPLLLLLMLSCYATNAASPPEELGRAHWLRDFEQGLERAGREGKLVFLLFQEVPGCSTCRNFGQEVLSHPLIVEAIETLFVPVAIYNNKGGKDAEVLKFYNEPAWNNPVVRIVGFSRFDAAPRVSGNYSQLGVVQSMVFALEQHGQAVPAYLRLFYEELQAERQGTETLTLSMYCFWTGEKQLGQLDGVVDTHTGFMNGQEVVQVTYNPGVLSFEAIVKTGRQQHCADRVFTHSETQQKAATALLGKENTAPASTFRPGREPKYYLSKTHYRAVPMTPLQAARANALIGQGLPPEKVLSPRQLALAEAIGRKPESSWDNAIGKDIMQAWQWGAPE
ncbi:MAG: thioredoxin family protein [Lewinellaceae bacterium]|nr:thioredoxin family protein [Lewinellaceae bacterium]